ncbi:MAG TPA: hypothetical protein VE592_02195 [Geminicoccaceae bacterium]|jgi:hypothetical protein|nr:hypothetical protein [Geminicoccaceae bacterium]
MSESPIEVIRDKLTKYPEARFRRGDNFIVVMPRDESGFEVGLREDRDGYTVNFDGWHEAFEDREAALNCFAFGLSSGCRLHVEVRGAFRCKWVLEYEANGQWYEDSTVGLIFFPFWRRPKTIYLQNHLIPPDA